MKRSVGVEIVERCVKRQDGSYLIITNKKNSAISPTPLNVGMSVKVEPGSPYGKIQ